MNPLFADASADILANLGEPVTAQHGTDPAITCTALVEDGVARLGAHGQIIGRVTKVTFLRTDFLPVRGDTVTTPDGAVRKVEAIELDDGYIVEAVLHG